MNKYSLGIGDRFGYEGVAQLEAILKAEKTFGIKISPVWNKSNREHEIIGTKPIEVKREAEEAVETLKWNGAYYIDADHINLNNVERFIPHSNFFTIDVADYIPHRIKEKEVKEFLKDYKSYFGEKNIPKLKESLDLSEQKIAACANKYMFAVKKAGKVYRYISDKKGGENFITEISMDETDTAQTPAELFVILAMIHHQKIPIDTIAPKFTGYFYKGIDYVGDLANFKTQFEKALAVLSYAKDVFHLKPSLKLSIHSGSDKFSLYPIINKAIKEYKIGLHLKTAGTTWLEEVIGLSEANIESLNLVIEIYRKAFKRLDELIEPYDQVVNIQRDKIPKPEEIKKWTKEDLMNAITHDPSNPEFNKDLRQVFHISYGIAAEMGGRFYSALEDHREVISNHVTKNLFERHIKRLFH